MGERKREMDGSDESGRSGVQERPFKRVRLGSEKEGEERGHDLLEATERLSPGTTIDGTATAAAAGPSTAYLDTIRRQNLDFDGEKVCSVTLSRLNVYACLVCGRYFQGRGKTTPAYGHGIEEDHHVFINLETTKVGARVYILPDNYESKSHTLDDIKIALDPILSATDLDRLGRTSTPDSYDLAHKPYQPGFIGLNNIKNSDYMNVVLHALLHVRPLVKALAVDGDGERHDGTRERRQSSALVTRFGQLARKYWNPDSFKGHLSPHEFLQEVNSASKRRFKATEKGDPLDLLTFLLHALHSGSAATNGKSSVIHDCFQGRIRLEKKEGDNVESVTRPFMTLALDLPPAPVFQDSLEKNVIPQVPLTSLLAKYAQGFHESSGRMQRYQILKLPRYLIFYMTRFKKSAFVDEKNPTVVTFAPKNLDLTYLLPPDSAPARYDLLANIYHESAPGTAHQDAIWRIHLHTKADTVKTNGTVASNSGGEQERWYQLHDLRVEQVNVQMIILGESYIQIWERRI